MIDTTVEFGLGAIQSPPDARDWTLDMLYATTGVEAPDVAALPAAFRCPSPYPPILNQGSKPQCVAYATAASKRYQDMRDQRDFDSDEGLFFTQIGGTAKGADPRVALQQLLDHGYPPVGAPALAATHRIAAYYGVTVLADAIKSALVSFGPVLLSLPWYDSWFSPVNGVLPPPNFIAGGHEIVCDGYNAVGLELIQSWGTAWGNAGRVTMPWNQVPLVWNIWKSVDVVSAPPTPARYSIHIAPHAHVKRAILIRYNPPRIAGWKQPDYVWGASASSASCRPPRILKGTHSGQATVAFVPRGAFAGEYVNIGFGVTLVRS